MWVHLIDADSKIPNLALMKLSAYYKAQGAFVTISRGDTFAFSNRFPDRIYISIVFKKNKNMFDSLRSLYPYSQIDIGGSGYDLHKTLPDEIECLKPDYSLYPDNDANIGFSSRGCIRNCYFCIVPEKEGEFKRFQHPEAWYNPEYDNIVFLDNNILADKEWFMEITSWCLENKLKIWFTQGLDIRLLDLEIARRLFEFKSHHMITFAWDNMKDERAVREGVSILKQANFTDSMLRAHVQFYIYVDCDDDYESGVYRCRELKKLGCNTFVMFNIDNEQTQRITNLKRWSKGKCAFWLMDIDDYKGRLSVFSAEKAVETY